MAEFKTETPVQNKIAPKTNLKEPGLFKVIFLNDNVTTMEFVVEVLRSIFDYTDEDAVAVMQEIHEEDSAVVATLPYEMAEQKGVEVTLLARTNGFPLQVKLEPNE